MLKLENITYQPQTGNIKILDNIDLKINTFEIVLICGKSGCGKTTLLEIICGLINQQNGNILWNDKYLSASLSVSSLNILFSSIKGTEAHICLVKLIIE